MPPITRIVFCLCLWAFGLGQASALTLGTHDSEVNLNHEITYWEDRTGKATLEDVLSPLISQQFQTPNSQRSVLNLGLSQSAYWVRITLNRTPSTTSQWVLEIPYLGIGHINLYQPDGAVQQSGSLVPVSDRPVFSRFYDFPVTIGTQPESFYLRIRSDYPISLPMRLIDEHRFYEIQARENLLQFAYFGGLLSLLIYNLSLFLFVRDTKYLSYSLFTFFAGLGIFAGNGYASIYFWPNSPNWDAISQPCLLATAGFFAIFLSTAFLRTRQYLPKIHICLMVIGGVYFAIALILFTGLWLPIPPAPAFQTLFTLSLITPIIVVGAALRNIRYGIHSARFFLLAWGVLCVGAWIAAARVFDLIPSNGFTLYALQISSGVEMLLFSLALAYRIQWERDQREKAQSSLIAAQEETVRALLISEERLENAVNTRTQKLKRLLLSEQHMRSQYTRFCAMIAHEFRNPLNIIQAQATVLDRDLTPSKEKNHQRTSVIRSAIGRLVTLFDQWLANDRINMAMDQLNPTNLDLGQWLKEVFDNCAGYYVDHTLRLAPPKEAVRIHADAHLLEIAVLNLIGNACKYSPKDSSIDVTALIGHDTDEVGIRIRDQGPGIPADQLCSILEPYVRAAHEENAPDGIGLGLAFVQRITELHNGRIEIDSTLGQGTTVTLWLTRA